MKHYFVFIAFLFYSVSTFAYAKKADGYIITNAGDTIYGKIKVKLNKEEKIKFATLQDQVIFYDEEGKKTIYLPGEIRSFYFYFNEQTPSFVSVEFYKSSQLFLMVIGDQGYLKLYKYYPGDEKSLASAYELAEYVYGVKDFDELYFFYVLKPDGERLLLGRHTPQNKLISFFEEHTEIRQKLESREFNYADIYKIVRMYNQWKSEDE